MRCTQEGGTDGVGGVGIGREVGMGRLRLGVVGEGGEAGDERLEAVGRAALLGILLGGLTRLESQVSESAGAKDQTAKHVVLGAIDGLRGHALALEEGLLGGGTGGKGIEGLPEGHRGLGGGRSRE